MITGNKSSQDVFLNLLIKKTELPTSSTAQPNPRATSVGFRVDRAIPSKSASSSLASIEMSETTPSTVASQRSKSFNGLENAMVADLVVSTETSQNAQPATASSKQAPSTDSVEVAAMPQNSNPSPREAPLTPTVAATTSEIASSTEDSTTTTKKSIASTSVSAEVSETPVATPATTLATIPAATPVATPSTYADAEITTPREVTSNRVREIDTNDVVPPPLPVSEENSLSISDITPTRRSKSITSLEEVESGSFENNLQQIFRTKSSDTESGSIVLTSISPIEGDSTKADRKDKKNRSKKSQKRDGSLPLPSSSLSLKREQSPRTFRARMDDDREVVVVEVSRERIAVFESLIKGLSNNPGTELSPPEATLLAKIVEEMEARADAERELKTAKAQILQLKKENGQLTESLKGEAAGLLDWAPKEVADLNTKAQDVVKVINDMVDTQKKLQRKATDFQAYLGGIFNSKLVKASDKGADYESESDSNTSSRSGSRIHSKTVCAPDPISPKSTNSFGSGEITNKRPSSTRLAPFLNSPGSVPNLSTPQLYVQGTYATPDTVIAQISSADPLKITEELSPKEKILRELIETERSYVKDLALTIKYYLEPLRTSPYLKPSDHNVIFSNIQLIFSIHQAILQKLETLTVSENVGVVFVQMAEFFRMYTQYCTNQPFSCELLKKAVKNTAFYNFLEELRTKNEELCRLDLPSYLIKPIQRLCKYPLLMEQLKRTTDKNDDEYADLHTAVSKINEIVALVNTEKNIAENQTKLMQLNETIAFNNKEVTSIVSPGRIIVKEGSVKLVSEKGKRVNCSLVLFNDAMIVLRKATGMGKKWKYETYVQLDNAYFAADASDEDKNGFKMNLINKKQTYIWIAKSSHERDVWISEINSCISKLLAQSEPQDEEITFIGEGKTKQPTSKSLFTSFSQKTL